MQDFAPAPAGRVGLAGDLADAAWGEDCYELLAGTETGPVGSDLLVGGRRASGYQGFDARDVRRKSKHVRALA